MEQSRVMQNADFLRELAHANYNRQSTIVQDANQRQISALSDVSFDTCSKEQYPYNLVIATFSVVTS